MSRTRRRKNYEDTQGASWDRASDKIAGFYTVRDWSSGYWENGVYVSGHTYYRAPTEREYHKEYWRIHGESDHACAWTPGRYHRQYRMEQNRRVNDRELCKWLKDPDGYEPLFEENPRSHVWDWD